MDNTQNPNSGMNPENKLTYTYDQYKSDVDLSRSKKASTEGIQAIISLISKPASSIFTTIL